MSDAPIYKDASRPIEERVEDLLGRMTLEEKVGQMTQLDGRVRPLEMVAERQPGSFLQVLGDDVTPIIEANEQTRLQIPILFGVDAIHGHSFWPGATIFPTQLGLACSWNEELAEQAARITAIEMSSTGVAWTFSPLCCLTRDLRWGRVGETFGEDPYLIGKLAAAMIKGYQGDDLSHPDSVLACAKHYAGYSETQGGRDASEADISVRKLRSYFLPPFLEAVKAGAGSFMTGYQSMEGLPSTANKWLLREVLKEEWGFAGFLVTDWDNVGRMVWEQKVSPDHRDAAARAIEAGNDLSMSTPGFWQGAIDAVRDGLVSEAYVDEAVRRMLRAKFALGLFENQRKPTGQDPRIGCDEHRAVALQAARECIVLLRNEGRVLPLDPAQIGCIAVIGPNADDDLAQLGDWSLGTGQAGRGRHPRTCTSTVLDGLRAVFDGAEVVHAPGCRIVPNMEGTNDPGLHLIAPAVAAAQRADAAVLVLGDNRRLVGECQSTATLELQGGQIALAEALAKTGVPLIVVLINSKPMVLPQAVLDAAVIIEAFSPGMLGGQAIAELIAGQIEPSGRLPISFPKHVGQQPIFYSQVRGQHGNRYADLDQEPVFAFGEGLSYSECRYGVPRCLQAEIAEGESVSVQVRIRNAGSRPMVETVQCYLRDEVTSVTWVDRSLVAWQRVALQPGEERELTLTVPFERLSLVDAAAERIVEPGDFSLLVGPSSRPRDLQAAGFRYVR